MSFFGTTQNQPKKKKSLGNINADDVNSSQQAQPITWFAGRRIVAGQFLSPGYNEVIKDVQGTTGKGEQGTVAHVYFCDFGLVIAFGGRMPVEGIYKIIVDSEIVWKNDAGVLRGTADFEDITVDKHGIARIYWGTETQPIDPLVFTTRGVIPIDPDFDKRDKSTWPADNSAGVNDPVGGHYDLHPAYRGQCYIVFKKWKLGRERSQIPNIQVEVQRSVAWFGGAPVNPGFNRSAVGLDANASGVNIAGCLYEWFTDSRYGRGYPDAKLNKGKWEVTATAIFGLRVSPLITSEDEFKTAVAKALEYFDGWIRVKNGLIELGYFAHGAINVGALPVITDNDLNAEPQLKPSTYKDAFTRLTMTISHKAHYYQARPGGRYDNAAMKLVTGQPKQIWLDREWLTDPAISQQVAAEEGKIRSLPTQSGELAIKREWLDAGANRSQGDRCVLNSSLWNVNLTLRINKVKRAQDSSGEAVLTVENERSIWPQLYIPPFNDPPGDFFGAALPIPLSDSWMKVFELPAGLRTNLNRIQVTIFVRRPSVSVYGFNVFASVDGTVYDLISSNNRFSLFGSQPAGTSYFDAVAVLDTTTGLVLDVFGPGVDDLVSQTDQQRDDNTLLLFIGSEIMSVGQVTALGSGRFKFFVRRALYGSGRTTHAGQTAFIINRAQITAIEWLNFLPAATRYFKIQTFTDNDILDIASAPAFPYPFDLQRTHSLPSISPGSCSFTGTLNASIAADTANGAVARYSLNGTDPNIASPEWPKSGGSYTTLAITQSCIVKVREFFPDGTVSDVAVAIYTLVGASPGAQSAAPVAFQFSGRKGQTGGSLAMLCATASSTIHYTKNGGSLTTYSTAITIALNDVINAYSTASGFADSVHSVFDNTKQDVYGGGGGTGIGDIGTGSPPQ
jgi:hypothetical protein